MQRLLRSNWLRRWLTLAGVVCLCLLLTNAASACPQCRAALANREEGAGDLARGLYWSILFMLSMPFAILGGVSSYFYYLVRSARGGGRNPVGEPTSRTTPSDTSGQPAAPTGQPGSFEPQ